MLANLAIHLCEQSLAQSHDHVHLAIRACRESADAATQAVTLLAAEEAMARMEHRLAIARRLAVASLLQNAGASTGVQGRQQVATDEVTPPATPLLRAAARGSTDTRGSDEEVSSLHL